MKFKIIAKFLKDLSFEIPNAETLFFLGENIQKYQLKVDIKSFHLKNKNIQVDLILKFENESNISRKAHIEATYSIVAILDEDLKDKNEIQRIILVDIPSISYPTLVEIFINLLKKSGLSINNINSEIDFEKLYIERSN